MLASVRAWETKTLIWTKTMREKTCLLKYIPICGHGVRITDNGYPVLVVDCSVYILINSNALHPGNLFSLTSSIAKVVRKKSHIPLVSPFSCSRFHKELKAVSEKPLKHFIFTFLSSYIKV